MFQIVRNASSIPIYDGWTEASEFESKGSIVDRKGNTVTSAGPLFQIIGKQVHALSQQEKEDLSLVKLFPGSPSDKLIKAFQAKGEAYVQYAVPEIHRPLCLPQAGKTVYFYPQVVFRGTKLLSGEMLTFARIVKDGKEALVAVTSKDEYKTCRPYNGSFLEALFKIAQDPGYQLPGHPFPPREFNPVEFFLNHPANTSITPTDFFAYILENDADGFPRICTLDDSTTEHVLTIAKEKNLSITFTAKTPQGETLFSQWIKKYNFYIAKLIVEIDPSAIEQAQEFFYELVMGHQCSIQARWLLQKAIDHPATIEEHQWIQKVLKNDITPQEFLALPTDLTKKLYFYANTRSDCVQKLRPFVSETEPRFLPGPSQVVAPNMDRISAGVALDCYFVALRSEGLLLTQDEVAQLYPTKFKSQVGAFRQIQGAIYMANMIAELGLRHLKVPKKIIIIPDAAKNIHLQVGWNGQIDQGDFPLWPCYVERITPVDRKITLEEAKELAIILEKTGMIQFQIAIVIAGDGIYFEDTEFKHFSPSRPNFASCSIKKFLDPREYQEFENAMTLQSVHFEKEKKQQVLEDKYTQFLQAYANRPFLIEFSDHLPQNGS
jgi:hypothetical protein